MCGEWWPSFFKDQKKKTRSILKKFLSRGLTHTERVGSANLFSKSVEGVGATNHVD